MDKYEYQAKLEEMKNLIDKEEYDEAVALADTIEWKKVRSVRTLCMVSELYESVGRVEDSKNILYRAYRRSPNSRQILYRLAEVCVQTQDFDDAVEYYTEYVNLSPHDNSKYILKYEIYKGRGSSVEEQIQVLEELKSHEYTEQWAYELAKLYDEAGMADKCVAECDDLALWFHNGQYVVKALELKQKYQPLTPEQQTIYDNPSSIVDMETKEAAIEAAVPTLDEEITKEIPKSEKEVIADSILMNTEKELAAAVTEHKEGEEQQKEEAEAPKSFSTVNIQNELASSMRQILSGIRPAKKTGDLESAPVMQPAAAEEQEEEQIEGQMSIDDLLTGSLTDTAEEKNDVPAAPEMPKAPAMAEPDFDILSAPTINMSETIKKEIGEKDLRAYAAEQAAAKAAEEKAAAEAAAKAAEEKAAAEAAAKAAEEKAAAEAAAKAAEEKAAAEAAAKAAEEKAAAEAAKAAEEKPAESDGSEKAQESTDASAAETESAAQEVSEAAAETQETAEAASQTDEQAKVDPMSYEHPALDEREKSMLGFWSTIRGMNEQVNDAIVQMMRSVLADKTSSRGNVILVGDAGNGRTTLALGMAKILARCKGLQSAKAAKIYAEDLNNKDIAATVSKISGGVLIIEEAGDLSDNAVAQLSMAMDFKTDGLIVFLEDERRYLQDLLARNPQFAQKFDITVNVPTLTNDELVEFGRQYALQNDSVMDDSAILTLYDGIGVLQNSEQPVAILDVKEIMDKAIRKASKFSIGKLFSTISGKRYDEEDRVIIRAKHFAKIK